MEPVVLFPTCVVDTLTPEVGVAAVRVLRRQGFEVRLPREATCCGQPAWNAGFAPEAARVAHATLAALEGTQGTSCVPAGSCATMIRVFWPELFEITGDHAAAERARQVGERVRELSELLSSGEVRGSFARKVAYHHSCHMLRELGLRDEPVSLLEVLEGCEVCPWTAAERCCGFGGLFSVKQPETSVAMADDKLEGLPEVDVVVGADSSCLLHLATRAERRGRRIRTMHIAEVLDEAGPVDGA
jgi:L-lactate dehydrogenase complex protein LldE